MNGGQTQASGHAAARIVEKTELLLEAQMRHLTAGERS